MHKELKRAILSWLLDHENEFQRVNACRRHFRAYVFDVDGNYLIGGEEVNGFIQEADKLLFRF